MPAPVVAVVAPLTGPHTPSGAVLLAEVERIRTTAPGTATWQVHHEAEGVGEAVADGAYAAVIGHADPLVAEAATVAYERAHLACLLPFVRGRAPAVSWAADGTRLARTLAESAAALGAASLTVAYEESTTTDEAGGAPPAEEVVARAREGGMTACTASAADAPSSDALVLLAPQDRLPSLLRSVGHGRYRAVLVVADCGMPSFTALTDAARGLPVWAVHAELCRVRRARVAITALNDALTGQPALRGPRLAAAVMARSAHLLGAGGGVLGEGLRVSRLSAVCPVRTAVPEPEPVPVPEPGPEPEPEPVSAAALVA
ncbi:hypothetical protein I2W78_23650 [Streptomyces spinoverrucosus]|uniref:hypothetical protein n=1 Tax=Streptomyces spinoverrucosus TaxID=284043 RepID=UPI0018C42AEF|nr:hypothetical protein [Streptomyces spinoverrucosus]MBG0854757.1 hypothetical protein [Streptomyces spinoverrucosus]